MNSALSPFFAICPEPCAWLSSDGLVQATNPAWNQIQGESGAGRPFLSWLSSSDRGHWLEILNQISLRRQRESLFQWQTPQGTRKMTWQFHWHDSPAGIAVVGREVRWIRQSPESLLREFMDHTPSLIFARDQSGRLIEVNAAFEKTFGISRDKAIGQKRAEIYPPEIAARMARDEAPLWQGGPPLVSEERIPLPNGQWRTFLASRFPLRDEQGRIYAICGIATDVTEQKWAQQKLMDSAKMSSLGLMAAGVAHEINNPLAIINGKANVLRNLARAGQLTPEKLAEDLDKIEQTTLRIARIIRGLRTFSRNADHDPFDSVVLAEVVEETLALCRERFRHHGVDLVVGPIPELRFEGRAAQISQVLLNLLNNAFDATEGQPNAKIRLDVQDLGPAFEMAVTDSGSTIPDAVAQRLMEPFFTTKEVGKGIGLGLAISRGIAEEHGGSLFLDRNHPQTRFVLRIAKNANDQHRVA